MVVWLHECMSVCAMDVQVSREWHEGYRCYGRLSAVAQVAVPKWHAGFELTLAEHSGGSGLNINTVSEF